MLTVRRAEERGHAEHGWLHTHHTFSFADYYDRRHMGFGPLRVINDDLVEGGGGFPAHHHRDMEILTYILEGALEHQDSTGTGSIIRRGDLQRMSAGTGVVHSEYNPSEDEPVRLLQIWIRPARRGLTPGYEQKHFSDEEKRGRLRLLASPDGAESSLRLAQDVRLYAALLERGDTVQHAFGPGRVGWLHLAQGTLVLNGTPLKAGDGVAITAEREVTLRSDSAGEVLLFDLPSERNEPQA